MRLGRLRGEHLAQRDAHRADEKPSFGTTSMIEAASWLPSTMPRAYVCGPTSFVESVATLLVELGHDPARVRTERFGPTS